MSPALPGPWVVARLQWPSRFGNILGSDIFQTVTFHGGKTASGLRDPTSSWTRTAGLLVTPRGFTEGRCTCCVEWSRCLGLSARLG